MPFEGHDLWPTVWPTSIRKNDIDTNNFVSGLYRTNPYEITFISHTHIPKLKWMFTLVSMTFDLRFDLYIWAEIAWTLTISFSDDISETYGEVTFILHTHITSLILHHSNKIYAVSYMVIKLSWGGGEFRGERGLSRLPYVSFCYTPPDKVGVGGRGNGVASDVQPSRPPSVCPHFVSEGELGNPWIDIFNYAHTQGCRCAFWSFWNLTIEKHILSIILNSLLEPVQDYA